MTVIRYPFSDEFERDEDAWEAPDALGVSGAEAAAKNAPFVRSIWEWIGYPALLTIAWSAGAATRMAHKPIRELRGI